MKNDALKKHHFWILLGLIPLLVLISVVMITSGVGAAIAERQSAIEAAKGELAKSSSPKPGESSPTSTYRSSTSRANAPISGKRTGSGRSASA